MRAAAHGIVRRAMLRDRLFTNLLFNLLLSGWVLHDARTRRAAKPAFAAFLALLWGPLGLAFWASERPLAMGERRAGGRGWAMATNFLLTWTVLLPSIFVLVVPAVRERSAVPGSLGAMLGVVPASAVVTLVKLRVALVAPDTFVPSCCHW